MPPTDPVPAPAPIVTVPAAALRRFQVMARVVGVMLLALVAAMVAKYGFEEPRGVEVVSPVHGFLYMVYLVVAFVLGRQARWSLALLVGVLLAGTVPLLSFVVERRVSASLEGV